MLFEMMFIVRLLPVAGCYGCKFKSHMKVHLPIHSPLYANAAAAGSFASSKPFFLKF
jgi:hypothetical protein